MTVTKQTLRTGLEETVGDIDFFGESSEGHLTFTILLGDVDEDEWETTKIDIEIFEDQYDVNCKRLTADGMRARYKVVPEEDADDGGA